MHIEHIAIWVKDISQLWKWPAAGVNAYAAYSDSANDIYQQFTGLIHFAVSVGSEEKVDKLTALLQQDGYELIDGPRRTGDGYYESVILDPEKNRIEITV